MTVQHLEEGRPARRDRPANGHSITSFTHFNRKMDIWELLPLRSLGFICLIMGLAPGALFATLRTNSHALATVLGIFGICLVWIPPALFQPKGRHRLFRKTMAIVRSVLVFGCFAFVASGGILGRGVGYRLTNAIIRFDISAWWSTFLSILIAVLFIDLVAGAIQKVVSKPSR